MQKTIRCALALATITILASGGAALAGGKEGWFVQLEGASTTFNNLDHNYGAIENDNTGEG